MPPMKPVLVVPLLSLSIPATFWLKPAMSNVPDPAPDALPCVNLVVAGRAVFTPRATIPLVVAVDAICIIVLPEYVSLLARMILPCPPLTPRPKVRLALFVLEMTPDKVMTVPLTLDPRPEVRVPAPEALRSKLALNVAV